MKHRWRWGGGRRRVNQSITNESAEEVETNMSLHDFHASEWCLNQENSEASSPWLNRHVLEGNFANELQSESHRFGTAQRNAPAVWQVYLEHLWTSLNIVEHLWTWFWSGQTWLGSAGWSGQRLWRLERQGVIGQKLNPSQKAPAAVASWSLMIFVPQRNFYFWIF